MLAEFTTPLFCTVGAFSFLFAACSVFIVLRSAAATPDAGAAKGERGNGPLVDQSRGLANQ